LPTRPKKTVLADLWRLLKQKRIVASFDIRNITSLQQFGDIKSRQLKSKTLRYHLRTRKDRIAIIHT